MMGTNKKNRNKSAAERGGREVLKEFPVLAKCLGPEAPQSHVRLSTKPSF